MLGRNLTGRLIERDEIIHGVTRDMLEGEPFDIVEQGDRLFARPKDHPPTKQQNETRQLPSVLNRSGWGGLQQTLNR